MMPTFPQLSPQYEFIRRPSFVVDVVGYGNQKEQRLLRTPNPRYVFVLKFVGLSQADKNTIQQFYIQRKGRWEAFDFYDPDPNSATYGQTFQVRFAQDSANFEYFCYQLWAMNQVELVTC